MEKQKLEKKLKILLVEDSLDKSEFKEIADYVRKASDEKAHVELAVDVKSGLEKIEKTDYDLVVTDLGLPQKPGYTGEELVRPECEKAFEKYVSPLIEKQKEKQESSLSDSISKLFESSERRVAERRKRMGKPEKLDSLETLIGVAKRSVIRSKGGIYMPSLTPATGGIYIYKKAKEKGIPATIFTDIHHFQEGIIGTILAGYMSIEQLEQTTSQIDETFAGLWEPISSKTYVKTDQIYVGSKKIRAKTGKKPYVADTKTFTDVILDAAKSYKLIEK